MSERARLTTKTPETKMGNPASKTQRSDFSQPTGSPVDHIMFLQRTIGNQAVQRMLNNSAGSEEHGVQSKRLCAKRLAPCTVQAKLTIGQPNDVYEQEADRVAEQVMRIPEPAVQKKCAKCNEKDGLTIKSEPNSSATSDLAVPDHFVSSLGHGQPLDKASRDYFEPRFGMDFSHVRVHSGLQAVESASSISALAYTLGNNVVFGAGQYQPETIHGKRLLTHELTHVVQQKSGFVRLQRRTDPVTECSRSGAQACLVHLHGSEEQALQSAKDLYCGNCVNLVYIDRANPCRLIQVDVSIGGPTCCADPNRIFDDTVIANKWSDWNKRRGEGFDSSWNVPSGACRDSRCLATAGSSGGLTAPQQAIKDYRDNQLWPALNRCGNRSAQVGSIGTSNAGGGLSQAGLSLSFVAFHQNIDTSSTSRTLSIRSYCIGGREYMATEQGPLTQGSYNIVFNNHCTVNTGLPPATAGPSAGSLTVHNPHIETGQDIDDFMLVTQPADFIEFVRNERNVVLQSTGAPNDGSLSIVLRNERYINIEAQRPARGRTVAAALSIQTTLGQEALRNVLNVGTASSNCPPAQGNSAQCSVCSSTATGSPGTSVSVTSPPSLIRQIQRKNLTMNMPDALYGHKGLTAGISGRIALSDVIQRSNHITEADLPSPTARGISRREETIRRFMREVFRRQVLLWMAQGATYLHELSPTDVVTLPSSYAIPGRTIHLHRDIEHAATNMIDDARAALRSAGASTGGTTNLAVRSGYRSATEQFGIWTTWAPQYYRRTMTDRRDQTRFPAGQHSDDAAQFLAEYTNERVHSPGYSQHQRGRTIDVSYEEGGSWAPADTSPTWISNWQGSWFFGWLRANAFRYGFFQNPRLNEPWHWEFIQPIADLLRLIQQLLDASNR